MLSPCDPQPPRVSSCQEPELLLPCLVMHSTDPPPPRRKSAESTRLSRRFPGVHHPSLADKDFDHLTSDRRMHREVRTWFRGEIAAATQATRTLGLAGALLVTRRSRIPSDPVEVAPSLPPRASPPTDLWAPPPDDYPPDLRPGTAWCLLYRRPAPRSSLGRHIATLSGKAKQRLAAALAAVDSGRGKEGA